METEIDERTLVFLYGELAIEKRLQEEKLQGVLVENAKLNARITELESERGGDNERTDFTA